MFGFQTVLLVRTFLKRDDGDLSEIRTCSDFGRLLYFIAGNWTLKSPVFRKIRILIFSVLCLQYLKDSYLIVLKTKSAWSLKQSPGKKKDGKTLP